MSEQAHFGAGILVKHIGTHSGFQDGEEILLLAVDGGWALIQGRPDNPGCPPHWTLLSDIHVPRPVEVMMK